MTIDAQNPAAMAIAASPRRGRIAWMGIDFRTDEEFPADDSGYGFDNIGDVLTVSPLLLEKYVQAAETIVAKAVPAVAKAVPVQVVRGGEFRGDGGAHGDRMTFYEEA